MNNKKEFVEKLLKEMTLEEKIGQMVQYGKLNDEIKDKIRQGKVGSLLNVQGAKTVNELQKIAVNETRLGIPLLIGDDVIHGYRTTFPIPLAESCSWDLDLIQKSASIAAKEAKSCGVNWIFAPMVDIARDPRWGRIAEGAGEDHYLGAEIAKARVKGFQTLENEYPLTASCPKHYVGYGAVIGGRDYNNVDMSENYLKTYYLPPFKAAYEVGALTTMCSFNDLFAVPLSVNKKVLRGILREELNFNGLVVSDWESVEESIYHRVSKDRKEAALKGLLASCDIDMHSGVYDDNLKQVVEEHPELIELIDEAVYRILSVKYDLGLFENPYVDEELHKQVILHPEHRKHALEVAKRSIVLLENKNGILPLKDTNQTIALIGPYANDQENHLGCWSCKGAKEDVISIYQALTTNLKKTKILVESACDINGQNLDLDKAIETAKHCDIIILALGEPRYYSGENNNRMNLNLPGFQEKLVEEIVKLNKPVIALIASGRPLTIGNISEKVDALVWTWHLGIEAGNAIYEVLFGLTNPSGKLTVTFPKHIGQIPLYYNHKSTGRPNFPRYIDGDDKPLYPFGYGLSYSHFYYSNLKLKKEEISKEEVLEFTIDVTNNGPYAGEEIVQVYFQDHFASVTLPVKQLCAFTKVYLEPLETKTVHFTISPNQFGLYNENNEFVIEPGTFTLYVGSNSVKVISHDFSIKE